MKSGGTKAFDKIVFFLATVALSALLLSAIEAEFLVCLPDLKYYAYMQTTDLTSNFLLALMLVVFIYLFPQQNLWVTGGSGSPVGSLR